MSYESNPAGIGVGKSYGYRSLYEGSAGVTRTAGYKNEIVIDFDHTNYDRVSKVIPEGAVVLESYVDVIEAFTFTGGTSPAIEIGTNGSEATNGAGLDFSTTGVNVGTLAGTWTSPIATDTTIGVAATGAPTSVDAGKARATIVYLYQGDLDGK